MTAARHVLVLGLAAIAAACASTARHPSTESLALTPYVGRLVTVDVTLQGQPLRLLFDTGAGLSMLTPSAAARIGCVPSGQATGWRMDGERVDVPLCRDLRFGLGAHARSLAQVGVFDLERVLPRGLPHVDGVLGLDAFDDVAVTIELRAHRLGLGAVTGCDVGAWLALPSRVATGIDGAMRTLFLGVDMPDGTRRWFELDSANLDGVRLSRSTAQAFGLEGDARARIDLALGPVEVTSVEARVRDLVVDGALDAEFFEQHAIRIAAGHGGVSVCMPRTSRTARMERHVPAVLANERGIRTPRGAF